MLDETGKGIFRFPLLLLCGSNNEAIFALVRLYGTPSFLGNGSEEGQRSGVPNLDSSTAAYQFSAAQFHTVDIAQKVLQISCSDEYTVAIVSGTESSVADRVVQWGVFGGTRISLPMANKNYKKKGRRTFLNDRSFFFFLFFVFLCIDCCRSEGVRYWCHKCLCRIVGSLF